MKKLLATLLVAAMLISCMSIVAFAANTATTVAQFPYAAMGTFDDSEWAYSDAVANVYYANIAGATGKTAGFLNNKSPLYAAMKAGDDNGANAVIPETVVKNEYVMVPLIVENVMAYDINVYYDSTNFQYVGAAAIYNPTAKDEGEYVHIVGYHSADVTGVMAGLYFLVKNDGIANAEFTVNVLGTSKGNGNLDVSQVAPTKMIVNKTAAAKPEKVTKDGDVKVSDAIVKSDAEFTADAGDKTFLAGKTNVVSGDGKEVDLYDVDGTYKAVFATNDFSGVQLPPEKFGLALYCNGALKGLYEAKSVVEGKWGILFYNLDSAKTYTTKKYVQYDGEDAVVED